MSKNRRARERRRNVNNANISHGTRRRRLYFEVLEDRRLLSLLPIGDDFRVNQTVAGVQRLAPGANAMGIDAAGNMVVAYTGRGARGGQSTEVFAQRLAPDGTFLGEPIDVNQFQRGRQDGAALAVQADGGFVVVWEGRGSDDTTGVFFRRFAADGTPLGGDRRANATSIGTQHQPSIEVAGDGRFVITWAGRGAGDRQGVFMRWFSAAGQPESGELLVNSTTAGAQSQPNVSIAPDGGYAVAWSGQGRSDSQGVFVQRFEADDTRIGGATRFSESSGPRSFPKVLAEENGVVVVVWSGAGGGDADAVFWRRLTDVGSLTNEVRVNAQTTGVQRQPALGAVGDGTYFVAWVGQRLERNRNAGWDIFSQQIDAAGNRLLTEQIVNSTRQGARYAPSIASNGTGRLAVGWTGRGSGDRFGVFARTYLADLDSEPPQLTAGLANDTGQSRTDGITTDPTIIGRAIDASTGGVKLEAAFDSTNGPLVDISDLLQADGSFVIARSRLEELAGRALVVGPHMLRLRATDARGNAADTTVNFTLQTDDLVIHSFDLSPDSDTGPVGDRKTSAGRVILVGRTEPLATVRLLETGAEVLAGSDGRFQFPGVTLAVGLNTFTALASNATGQTAQRVIVIERTAEAAAVDPVLRWNQAALDAARLDAATPPYASRAYAMVHAAIFDAVAAIEGTSSYVVSLPAPAGASVEAAIAAAGERVLSYLYPAQQSTFGMVFANALASVADGAAEDDGVALGRAIGDALIAIRSGDGWDDFIPSQSGDEPGEWQSTSPMHDPGLLPQWATLEPFAMDSPDQFRPAGPPALGTQEWADAYEQIRTLGAFDSTVRTAEQTQIARFWADGAGTFAPPGHWNQIARQFAESSGNSPAENARLFALLNIAMADAAIASWDAKYAYNFWRPVTAIQAGDTDNNDLTVADDDWAPFLITPPFPEYTSGHSTFSGAGAAILTALFGENQTFATTSPGLPGVTRTFGSFHAAAEEASISRIYGGIHYAFSGRDGLKAGEEIAAQVLERFSSAVDVTPPTIILSPGSANPVTQVNLLLGGQVLDNASGVSSLEVRLDSGAWTPVAFDANGRFTIPTQFSLSGQDDGPHRFQLRATDVLGNIARPAELVVTLDTRSPTLSLAAPSAGGTLSAGALLEGTADGTGSALTQLQYALDGGSPRPVSFDANGQFSASLDLSRLTAGEHTLILSARDAAGHLTTIGRRFQLDAAIPLTVVEHTPRAGALDVGSTYKPEVAFSRPIDPATLSAANFYATTPDGKKVPGKIVPGADNTMAWLFFDGPLPGGARITIHVDGSTILAAADHQPLDADGDGVPGGMLEFRFTTVSLTPLLGTTLSGRVFDPGPDLKPMTFDDWRAGPDGALFTADDVFLLPIAGAKVFIVGLEHQAVFTDAQGNFQFAAAPAGNLKLAIDGRTATNTPAGLFFPEMVMDQQLEAGRANTVMGTMGSLKDRKAFRDRQEVYLPRIENAILHTVSQTESTTIGVDPRSAPNLSPEQRAQLRLEVPPASLVDPQGNPLANGQVGISNVPPELVREMLPEGLMQLATTLTIQAPGVARFAAPLRLTVPNVYGAAPGSQLQFYSFDHDTGRLVLEGTATVSADGLSVTTDPGIGITKPGWHGITPPGGPGGPDGPPPDPPKDPSNAPRTVRPPVALPLITQEVGGLLQSSELAWSAPTNGRLTVTISVDGPLGQFMKQTGNLPLASQSFTLTPGSKSKSFKGISRLYDEMVEGGFRQIEGDRLYGSKITVVETTTDASGKASGVLEKSFYLYRWISATYAHDAQHRSGDIAAFQKTLDDGPFNWATTKTVEAFLPESVTTNFQATGPAALHFRVDSPAQGRTLLTWRFDPQAAGQHLAALSLRAIEDNLEIGELRARGTGIAPVEINVNQAGFRQELRRVLTTLQEVWNPGEDKAPGRKNVDDDANGKIDDESEYGWPDSDDHFNPLYRFGRDVDASTGAELPSSPMKLMDLRGPAMRYGIAGTVKQYVVKPGPAESKHAGNDGVPNTPDDESYYNFIPVSRVFQAEFGGFMPMNRGDAGPDGVFRTFDDAFTAEQLGAMDEFLLQKGADMQAAVEADFSPVDEGKGAYRFVDTTGNLTLQWTDTFNAPGGVRTSGLRAIGAPIYGFADFDADAVADFNSDGIVLKPILQDPKLPFVSQIWALAEQLNVLPNNQGSFGVAVNLNFKSYATFAQYVANSVSHEIGHTFGLLDAYIDMFTGFPGDAGADANGNAIPYDIMRKGSEFDPNLTFLPSNIQLLRAAMGIAPDGNLGGGVAQYKRTFNLPNSPIGIRENTPPVNNEEGAGKPEIVVVTEEGAWFGGREDTAVDLGTVEADGDEGESRVIGLGIYNAGLEPLDVTAIGLVDGLAGFSLEDPNDALGDLIDPGEIVEFFVRFDPSRAGRWTDLIEIASNAETNSVLRVPLAGLGKPSQATALLQILAPTNLGASTVGAAPAIQNRMAQITNTGEQPLVIQDLSLVRNGGPFQLLGVPSDIASNPISLAPGESFVFGARFLADKLGLARAEVQILTNDSEHPRLTLMLSGTGVEANGQVHWGRDLVTFRTPDLPNSPILQAISDEGGNFEFVLPAEEFYELLIFDPETGLIGKEWGVTARSGERTRFVSSMTFGVSNAYDTDQDGLQDDVELAIGTLAHRADSDGDGVDDFAEFTSGENPLDDRPLVTGIVAALELPDAVNDVAVAADSADPQRQLAYLAAGAAGLAIVDVTRFDQPVILAQLPVDGSVAAYVTLDSERNLVAISAGANGAHVIDVSDATRPVRLRTLPIAAGPAAFFDGLIYVGVGSQIHVFDPVTGEPSEVILPGSGEVLGLAREGTILWVLSADGTAGKLHAIDLSGGRIEVRGTLSLPRVGRSLFVADGIAWIASANEREPASQGTMAVDVSRPDRLTLLSDQDRGQRLVSALALNGSGLGVLAGRTLLVANTGNPLVAPPELTRFNLPANAKGVALSAGMAYVADGLKGLQIVNFLPFDRGLAPPQIALGQVAGDLDPATPGLQLLEGATVFLPAKITDDVQVRSVELLVNGTVVRTELSYPYDLSVALPMLAAGRSEVTLQLRATDTGGNTTLSEAVTIELVADTMPPEIDAIDPADGSTQPLSRRKISVQFTERLDRSTLSAENFVLLGPTGAVAPLSFLVRQQGARVELLYPLLAEGQYQFSIDAAALRDPVGLAVGTEDLLSTFRIGTVTRLPTIAWNLDGSGQWNDPANWIDVATLEHRLPTLDDDVLIDVPSDALITISGDSVQVNSIVSNERFQITGGRLKVVDSIQVNNAFLLRGPALQSVATLSGTVLRSTGGHVLTIGGDSRLDGATIQTDIAIDEANTRLRISNGLSLFGTATIAARNVAIGFEGSQIIDAGTFTTGLADDSVANIRMTAIGIATVTFAADVIIRGEVNLGNDPSAFQVSESVLHVVNYGTLAAGGTRFNSLRTSTQTLVNRGLITNDAETLLLLNDRQWTNAAEGRIVLAGNHSQFGNIIQVSLLGDSWTNAGTIEMNDVWTEFMRDPGRVWTNTGTLILNQSQLSLKGSFTSDDVRNVRSTDSGVGIQGLMDNRGRSFTFSSETGSYTLSGGGRILGGTIVSTGPGSRLEFNALGGTLDGVILKGDVVFGGRRGNSLVQSVVHIVNGLTLNGTAMIYDTDANTIAFDGPQTVSGGTFQFLSDPAVIGLPAANGIKAFGGGPVVLDASVTIRGGSSHSHVLGNIISYTNIFVEPSSTLRLGGINHINPAFSGPFVNRGTIQVPTGGQLELEWPFINEGNIVANGGLVRAAVANDLFGQPNSVWRNTGVIDLSGQGRLEFTSFTGTGRLPRLKTSDLGTILGSGGFVTLLSVLDNSGSTLVIDGTADWTLRNAVEGGTIEVAGTAKLHSVSGLLKDVHLRGNLGIESFGSLYLVGDITIDGTIVQEDPRVRVSLFFGDSSRYPNAPTTLRSGAFDIRRGSISGPPYAVTLESGLILRGRDTEAAFAGPLLNRGEIIADATNAFATGEVFGFTASPVTNAGTLSAINRSILRIANLAAPNAGIIAAASGGTVNFTGSFAQAPTGKVSISIGGTATDTFGHVKIASSVTLDGTLSVSFAAGFTPAVGNRFQVLDYASRSGQFHTIQVSNLPANLVVTPEYNSTNLTLVVSAAPAGAGLTETRTMVAQDLTTTAAAVDALFAAAGDPQAEMGGIGKALDAPRAAGWRVEEADSYFEALAAVMQEIEATRPLSQTRFINRRRPAQKSGAN